MSVPRAERTSPQRCQNDQAFPESRAKLELEDNLSYRLSMLSFLLGKMTQKIYAAEGLKSHEWKVLSVLDSFAPLAPSGIARWVTLDKAAISRALRELHRLGLAERHSSKMDARSIDIALTPAGKLVYARMMERTARLQKRLFARSTAEEIRLFFAQLDSLDGLLRTELDRETVQAEEPRIREIPPT